MFPTTYSTAFLAFLALPSALAQCYYPNGAIARGDAPCDDKAENSMCCASSAGAVCLSNKLCSGPNGNIIRGSCTDKDWHAPECASYCLGASTGGTDLISCLNTTGSDTAYCCDHTLDCCDTGVGRFRVLPSDPGVWARFNSREQKYSVVGTMFSSAPPSSETGATTSSSSTSTRGEATTSDSEASETAGNQDGSQADEKKDGLSVGAKAGIGVGAGLGLLVFVAIAVFLWKLRRRRRQPDDNLQQSQWGPGGGMINGGQAHEAMEKSYHGGMQEAPGVVPPRYYHENVQELPASPIPSKPSTYR